MVVNMLLAIFLCKCVIGRVARYACVAHQSSFMLPIQEVRVVGKARGHDRELGIGAVILQNVDLIRAGTLAARHTAVGQGNRKDER